MRKFLSVIVVFVIANAILIGIQRLPHLEDQRHLDQLKQQLDVERPEIEEMENRLRTLSANFDQMEQRLLGLKSDIRATEAKFPSGIPSQIYPGYSRQVDEYNAGVVLHETYIEEFESLYPQYSARVDQFNSLIGEAKALSDKIGSTWILIPNLKAFTR